MYSWVPREKTENFDLVDSDGVLKNAPDIVRRILIARRIVGGEEVKKILTPRLSELTDPYRIKECELSAWRLVQAFKQKEAVCIYADFDLDGTSGLALLYEGLAALGFQNLMYYQPKRLSEGYGFHPQVVEELASRGIKLIVTVDVGITAINAARRAKELGIEVIITDHHQPTHELPDVYSIVNPNRQGDSSGLGYLCGAGVVFYLLRAVQRQLISAPGQSPLELKSLLDYLAIATLTDLVPLVGDNRPLVKVGLEQLEKTKRPGLRLLLKELGLERRSLTGQDVAIRFAPKLNALSRMENGLLPVDLFLVKDELQAKAMVDFVLSNNEMRVHLQQMGEQKAREILKSWKHSKFIYVFSHDFHRGVIGLIATKLAQEFNVPVFVGSENKEGLIVGSSRTPPGEGVSVLSALRAAGDVLSRYGGHHSAAGFELHREKCEDFIDLLCQHFETTTATPMSLEYDFELLREEVSEENLRNIESLGPYGQGFSPPQFVIKNLKINKIQELRGGHLKFFFSKEVKFDGLFFFPYANLKVPQLGDEVDFLGELQRNYFAGKASIQFLIKDLKIKTRGVGS